MMATFRNVIHGPRFAGIPKFIKNECWKRGLSLEIQEDKGWIRETVRFAVSGEDEAVKEFEDVFWMTLKSYNQQDD